MKRTIRFCDRHDPEATADESITFRTADGEYEIDLCSQHADDWRTLQLQLADWVKSARSTADPPPRPPRSHAARAENAAIRAWAVNVGVPLGQRGRISDDLRARYREEVATNARARWNSDVNPGESPEPEPTESAARSDQAPVGV